MLKTKSDLIEKTLLLDNLHLIMVQKMADNMSRSLSFTVRYIIHEWVDTHDESDMWIPNGV